MTRRIRRRGAPLVLMVVLLGLGWLLADPGITEGEVHRLPDRGEVAAIALSDDRPAFLRHADDGAVTAVDARAPVSEMGLRGVVSWCEPDQVFIDPLLGHTWHADGSGRLLEGTTPRSDAAHGVPPPPLASIATETTNMVVQLEPEDDDLPPATVDTPFAPASCAADGTVRASLPGSPATVDDVAGALADGRTATLRLDGVVEQRPGESTRLCNDYDPCDDPVVLPLPAADPEDPFVHRYKAQLSISVRDGEVLQVLVGRLSSRSLDRAEHIDSHLGARCLSRC